MITSVECLMQVQCTCIRGVCAGSQAHSVLHRPSAVRCPAGWRGDERRRGERTSVLPSAASRCRGWQLGRHVRAPLIVSVILAVIRPGHGHRAHVCRACRERGHGGVRAGSGGAAVPRMAARGPGAGKIPGWPAIAGSTAAPRGAGLLAGQCRAAAECGAGSRVRRAGGCRRVAFRRGNGGEKQYLGHARTRVVPRERVRREEIQDLPHRPGGRRLTARTGEHGPFPGVEVNACHREGAGGQPAVLRSLRNAPRRTVPCLAGTASMTGLGPGIDRCPLVHAGFPCLLRLPPQAAATTDDTRVQADADRPSPARPAGRGGPCGNEAINKYDSVSMRIGKLLHPRGSRRDAPRRSGPSAEVAGPLGPAGRVRCGQN
jgi:hypothetical protein